MKPQDQVELSEQDILAAPESGLYERCTTSVF